MVTGVWRRVYHAPSDALRVLGGESWVNAQAPSRSAASSGYGARQQLVQRLLGFGGPLERHADDGARVEQPQTLGERRRVQPVLLLQQQVL